MTQVKNFFNITTHYIFDYNDVRCILTVANVLLIIMFGLSVAYVGLAIAIFGTVRDLVIEDRKLNSTLIHGANVLLNCWFVHLSLSGGF